MVYLARRATMTCTYCGSRNGLGETRCRRCGRKPGDTPSGVFPLTGNLAPKLAPVEQLQPEEVLHTLAAAASASTSSSNLSRAVQVPLFRERPASNIIPIEDYAPPRPAPKAEAKPAAHRPHVKRPSRVSENQGSLDFLPPAPPAPKKLGTTVEAVIYCDAPVAHPLHRAIAAAIDWSMVLIGYGLFLLTFRMLGGSIVLSKANLPLYGGALAMIAFTYGLFWALAATETLGMRVTKLRTITFDGFPPESRHRALRFLGSCLSYCTVVGLAWSLADEESLTWQDHISRTFPTYLDLEK